MNRPVTSASNLYRRYLCPGSERLEAGLPEDDDSEEARMGTLLHQYDANPKLERAFLSQRNRELLRIADICDEKVFERVREQFSIVEPRSVLESTIGETWWIGDGEDATPGHSDRYRYWIDDRLLCIIDKKFGFKEVTPAVANYQLRHYAVAGAEKFKPLNCVVAITQPRLPYEQRITMAHYSKEDIAAAREEIVAIREASRDPDAPLVPGEEQCRYCKAKLTCPALRAEMEKGFALVPVTGTLTKRKADLEDIITRCSDEDLDRIIQFVRYAKFVEDKAMEEGRKRVAAGALPTYELGKPSSPRYIDNPGSAAGILALRGLLDRTKIWDCASLALGKIEDAVAEGQNITMKEARKLVEEALARVIHREERKPSLIRKKP